MHPLDALAGIDAATLGTALPPAHARAVWAMAIEGARSVPLDLPLAGPPPASVTLVASANVFTAPIEWAWALSSRGVRVVLKSARGLSAVGDALAAALPGVEAHYWPGGDLDAEAAALADSEVAMVFGSAETIVEIRARSPVPVLGFGPRFGVILLDAAGLADSEALVRDHALYDGHGCMSPAAVFSPDPLPLESLERALREADVRWPAGAFTPADASARRSLAMLARIEGRLLEVGSWLVVALPGRHVRPRGLPRVMVVHEGVDPGAALAPWREELGTVAIPGAEESDTGVHEALAKQLGLDQLPPARVCAVGEMQRPPGARRLHDGVAVLPALWNAAAAFRAARQS